MKSRRKSPRLNLTHFGILLVLCASLLTIQTPAWAVGTAADTVITNRATITYQVGGVTQPSVDSDDPNVPGIQATTFRVDRMVDLTVSNVPTTVSYVDVPPNGADLALKFTVANTGNAPFYFDFSAVNYGTDPFGGTENQDVTIVRVVVDSDGAGGTGGGYISGDHDYDPSDTALAITSLAADQMINVYVVCNIPVDAEAGRIAAVLLTATAREPNTGAALTNADEGTAWAQNTMQTLFADGAGRTDAAEAADFNDAHAFRIIDADLAATKAVSILADGISTSNFKAIPGALVQYTIGISNSGATAAQSVAIADYIPTDITLNGVVSDTNSNASATVDWYYATSAAVPPAQPADTDWAAWPPADLTAVTWVRTVHSIIDAGGGTAGITFQATIN